MSLHPEFTIHDLLRNAAERDPDQIAIIDGKASHTYAELARSSAALCDALLEAGVRKGDRVGIYMEKSWEAVVSMLGVSQAGAAFVNVNPLLKPPQVSYILSDCDVRVLIGDTPKLASLGADIPDTIFYNGGEPPDEIASSAVNLNDVLARGGSCRLLIPALETDLATILYTSGSTGLPKGVAVSQRNLVVGSQIVSTYLQNTREDRILSVLPFSFDYGLNQLITALRVGATLVIQNSRLPGDLVRGLRTHEITGLAGVPPLWPLLLRAEKTLLEQPLEHLRYITNSGGRVPSAHLAELRRCLPDTSIFLMYGLTEAFRSTYLPPDQLHRGTECIGKPIPNTEIWVLDRAGRECPPGEVGELVHRGPTVAMGYWDKEEDTRKAFRDSPFAPLELVDKEKVVYSGDLVRRDEEGYLYFVGRGDQLIKTQGYRVSPEEVENLLISSGLVREACAFGVTDESADQYIVAVISLRDTDESALPMIREHCLRNGPPYMVPREIRVERELPKTSSGKVDRQVIRDAYSNR